jgi:Abortive infection C-terminus
MACECRNFQQGVDSAKENDDQQGQQTQWIRDGKLFKTVVMNLPMLPVAASAEIEARRSLAQTMNGLHTALHGVCELRNLHGFASHGKEEPRPPLGSIQALLAAQTADTIIGFFHRLHLQDRTQPGVPKLAYEDNIGFNDYVDEANEPVRIFDLNYQPSEVLFSVDLEAYRTLLADFGEEDSDGESGEASAPGVSA